MQIGGGVCARAHMHICMSFWEEGLSIHQISKGVHTAPTLCFKNVLTNSCFRDRKEFQRRPWELGPKYLLRLEWTLSSDRSSWPPAGSFDGLLPGEASGLVGQASEHELICCQASPPSAGPGQVLASGALVLRAIGTRLAGSMALLSHPNRKPGRWGATMKQNLWCYPHPWLPPDLRSDVALAQRGPVPLPCPLLHNHELHFQHHLPFLPIVSTTIRIAVLITTNMCYNLLSTRLGIISFDPQIKPPNEALLLSFSHFAEEGSEIQNFMWLVQGRHTLER